MATTAGSFLSRSQESVPVIVGALASIGLYAVALYLPAAKVENVIEGWEALFLIIAVFHYSITELCRPGPASDTAFYLAAALANLLLWAGWFGLLAGRPRLARGMGGLALLLGLLVVLEWCFGEAVYAGAYLWLASMAVVAVVGAWGVWRQASGSPSAPGNALIPTPSAPAVARRAFPPADRPRTPAR
jgi:hypothetical protein